jgi:hypothetical protein|tara:strand:+ start:946 stop:1764 length:819 start_codon:yes stop_codon:yes gene_type:complete
LSGFILLSRALLENDLWRANSDLVRLFLYLCMSASYGKKEYSYSRGGSKVTVRKGEFLRSLRKIGEDCAYTGNNKLITWSPSRVSAMLQSLEDDGRIEVVSNTSGLGTLIRIVNYESYQDFSSYSGRKKKGLGTDAEQTQNNSKQLKQEIKRTPDPEKAVRAGQVDALWKVWLDELSPKPPHPRLTDKRRSVLWSLYSEQLSSNGADPIVLFRKVLKAVKRSDHHMGTRAYTLPESLFRNEERRERWAHNAVEKRKAENITPTVSRTWSVEQ